MNWVNYSQNQNVYPYQSQYANTPDMQNALEMQAQQGMLNNQLALNLAMRKSEIEIREKQIIKDSSVEAELKLFMKKEDMKMKRELMKTEVLVSADGNLKIIKETFGGNLSDSVTFKVLWFFLVECISCQEKVLVVQYEFPVGKGGEVYLLLTKLDESYVNRKFNAAGLRFGFSHGKETEMRMKLISTLQSSAKIIRLPWTHGWYEVDGKLEFAFPESTTFEEVMKHV